MGAGDTQPIRDRDRDRSLAEQARMWAAIVAIIVAVSGPTGVYFVNKYRMDRVEEEVATQRLAMQAVQVELATQRERERAAMTAAADMKASMDRVQSTLRDMDNTLVRICSSLRGVTCK